MKKISIISSGSLKEIHGANYVIDFLIKSNKFFKNVSIIRVYSSQEILDVQKGDTMPIGYGIQTTEYRINRNIRSILRELLNSKYILFARIKLFFNLWRPAQKVVRKFNDTDLDTDALIFQDLFGAYSYFRSDHKSSIKTALIIHTEDDSLSQLFLTFSAFNTTYRKNKLYKIRDYVYENLDKIVYISDKAFNNSMVSGDKKVRIYNGILDFGTTNEIYESTHTMINFVCVGSMSGRKGQDLIIKALAQMSKEKLKRIHLYLVGDGGERSKLEGLVESSHLKDYITFTGQRNDVSIILETMDVFIMPSLSEGLSISTLEALRAGLFLLLTDTGGNSEVMGNECGFIINREISDIKKYIEIVIDNEVININQKQKSKDRFASHFSLQMMAEGYDSLFD